MTDRAIEMAEIIEAEHNSDRETAMDFCARRFATDNFSDLLKALDIVIARERGLDDLRRLLDLVKVPDAPRASIGDLVKFRRAKGYSAELEAIVSRMWQCRSCDAKVTLLSGVLLPAAGEWAKCAACGGEIGPMKVEADLSVIEGGRR